jgi:hypothetical protein
VLRIHIRDQVLLCPLDSGYESGILEKIFRIPDLGNFQSVRQLIYFLTPFLLSGNPNPGKTFRIRNTVPKASILGLINSNIKLTRGCRYLMDCRKIRKQKLLQRPDMEWMTNSLTRLPKLDYLTSKKAETGFLDINLTKDSSLLLHAIHSLFYCYWRILKKTILFSGFKNPYKKIRETRRLGVFSLTAFCRTDK